MDRFSEVPLVAPSRLEIGKFLIDFGHEMLLDTQGVVVELRPQAFRVLRYLALNAGRLVTKEELLATVWCGAVVTDDSVIQAIGDVRRAIGDSGHRVIKTIPRRGYILVSAEVVRDAAEESKAGGRALDGRPGDIPRRLSVIVLPFIEPQAMPDQEYFADAVTDDITTQLSKIGGSYVIGSPTALAYKREEFEVAHLARELGVRYTLQGRIERSRASVEINARLSDAATGAVIWSEVIYVDRAGVRNIRHEVVARLTNALGIHLFVAEGLRTRRENAEHPEAMDLVMQARSVGGLTGSRDHYLRALELLERSLQIDPNNAEALTRRAECFLVQAESWPGPEIASQIERAETDLVKSLALDSFDHYSHEVLSRLRYLQYRDAAAVVAADTALELNPGAARAHLWRGALHLYAGHCEATFGLVQRALDLSPRDPHRWACLLFLGMASLLSGDYAGAVKWLERSLAVLPSYWISTLMLIAAYAQLGQIDQAKALRERLGDGAKVHSKWVRVTDNPRFLSQMGEHYFEGLIKCGATSAEKANDWIARQRRNAAEARLARVSPPPGARREAIAHR